MPNYLLAARWNGWVKCSKRVHGGRENRCCHVQDPAVKILEGIEKNERITPCSFYANALSGLESACGYERYYIMFNMDFSMLALAAPSQCEGQCTGANRSILRWCLCKIYNISNYFRLNCWARYGRKFTAFSSRGKSCTSLFTFLSASPNINDRQTEAVVDRPSARGAWNSR